MFEVSRYLHHPEIIRKEKSGEIIRNEVLSVSPLDRPPWMIRSNSSLHRPEYSREETSRCRWFHAREVTGISITR